MNEARRKQLKDAVKLLGDAQSILETVRNEEQKAFNSLSENLQQSKRGQRIEETVGALQEAYDGIENIINTVDNASE